MGLFSRIAGFVNSFIQLGGPAGPGWNNNAGVIEAKNSSNTVFTIVRGATPLADNDLTTKAYVDESIKPLIVTAQANAPSALIANSGVEHYIVVSTAGTGAAAAYVAGTVLWDDGQSVGNVTILGPTSGVSIVTTASLAGGTFVFNANNLYIWTGSTWQNITANIAGAAYFIDYVIGTGAAQSSTTLIPANAIVVRSTTTITTPYSGGTTIKVGQTGTANLLQDTGDIFPTVADAYDAPQRTAWGGSPLAVLVTITGSPAAGAGIVTVEYSLAQA